MTAQQGFGYALMAIIAIIVVRAAFRSAAAWLRGTRSGQGVADDDDAVPAYLPSNPKYKSWSEVMHRQVTKTHLFEIEFVDLDGVVTRRHITPKVIHLIPHDEAVKIEAFCHLRKERRTFYSARILEARDAQTGKPIVDLGNYLRRRY